MPRRRRIMDDDEDNELRRDVIKKLRQRQLPTPGQCNFIANELEALWWPNSKAVKDRNARGRADRRQFWARHYRQEIDRIAAAEGIPKYEAKQKVVKHWKLHSVEALDSFLKREP